MSLSEVYEFIDELWFSNDLMFCWGCGAGTSIEHHHIISRQECNKIGKPDLLIDPENIIPLCYDCHHKKWHDGGIGDKMKLKCLFVILDYYKKEAPELYYKLKHKIEEYDQRNREDEEYGV